jgi:hypothetical protein
MDRFLAYSFLFVYKYCVFQFLFPSIPRSSHSALCDPRHQLSWQNWTVPVSFRQYGGALSSKPHGRIGADSARLYSLGFGLSAPFGGSLSTIWAINGAVVRFWSSPAAFDTRLGSYTGVF